MVLNRVVSIVRRRWLTAVIVAVVVAILGSLLAGRQQTGSSATSTSMTQVGVTGPLREHEQYSVDLNTVAIDVCGIVAPYLTSDVVLSKIRAELPIDKSLGALRSMVDVSILPSSSIIDIRASGADVATTDIVVAAMQREAISLIGTMGDKRFEGDSPLIVTILVDSTKVEKESGSTTVFIVAALVLALIAGVAAAWLRHVLDSKVRDVLDVRRELDGVLPVVGGSWDHSARRVRAELDVAEAGVTLVVPGGRGDAGPAFERLVQCFVDAGQPVRALVLRDGVPLEGFTEVDTLDAQAVGAVASGTPARVAAGAAVDATLTAGALSATIATLTEGGSRALVLTDGADRSTAFSLLRRTADAVVVVATPGVDRKNDIMATVAQVRGVRPDTAGDLVWFGA